MLRGTLSKYRLRKVVELNSSELMERKIIHVVSGLEDSCDRSPSFNGERQRKKYDIERH